MQRCLSDAFSSFGSLSMISNTVHTAILQPRALRGIVPYVKITDGNLATPDPAYAYRPTASDRWDDVMTVACEVWRRTLQGEADRSIELDKEMVGRRRRATKVPSPDPGNDQDDPPTRV